jgi:glucokinase
MRWPAGEVSPLNIPGWRGFALRQRLQDRFPGLPVRVHNDAVCVAVAEHWLGVGRDHDNLLGMVISTGVGGGLILAGHLVDGGTGNAGHVGHIVVEPAGPRCACGGRGCLEAIARGPAIIAWALDHGWRPTGPPTGQQLAGDAAAGDPTATAALERAGRAVGIAIASAANLCDFDAVAVAGGVSNAGRLLFDPMRAAFREHAGMDFVRRTRIEPAFLGPGAGLYGAAALVLQGDRYWSAD